MPSDVLGGQHFTPIGRPIAEELACVGDDVFDDQRAFANFSEEARSGAVVVDFFRWSVRRQGGGGGERRGDERGGEGRGEEEGGRRKKRKGKERK